eukprot:11056641-Alexandrium_andersonii.AAC.1
MPARMRACALACLHACVLACVLVCLRACVLACLHACVLACVCVTARWWNRRPTRCRHAKTASLNLCVHDISTPMKAHDQQKGIRGYVHARIASNICADGKAALHE